MRTKDEQRRQAIIEATAEMIISTGMQSVTMAKVAKKVKISQSNIYIYFKNKNDLLKQVYLHMKIASGEAMFRHFDAKAPMLENFQNFTRSLYHFAIEQPVAIQTIRQFMESPITQQLDLSETEGEVIFQRMQGEVERGIETGLLRKMDAQVMMAMAFFTILQYAEGVTNQTVDPVTTTLDSVIDMLTAAVLQPKD